MKFMKAVNLFVLTVLLVSCGPAVLPTPTPQMDETVTAPTPEVITPVPWKDVTEEWTFFRSMSYFSSQAYDPNGYLWLTSNEGVFRLNLESGEYEFFGKPETYTSGWGNLTFFDGTLWMVPSNGHVAYLSNGVWITEELATGYSQRLINLDGVLWYLGSDAIFYRENEEWKPFDLPEGHSLGFGGMAAKSGDGSLWFSASSAVLEYDGANWIEHENLRGANIMSLASGEVLFIYSGLILVYKNGAIAPVVLPGEIYSYSLNNSFLTPDGNFWFQAYSYSSDGMKTYLLTRNGVEQLPSVDFKDSPPNPELYSPALMTPKGWVFTTNGFVYLFDGEDWREYPMQGKHTISKNSDLNPIGFSADGKLWFMSGNRPISYDGEKTDDPFEESACDQYYGDGYFSPDGKSIWLGSTYQRNTLCHFDLESGKQSEGEIPFIANGMDVAPDGSLWVSSSLGFIARVTPYALRKGDYRLIEPIRIGGEDISNPLKPSHILVDALGSVWVYVPEYGIYRYKDGEWKNFGMADIDMTAFDVDSNGDVWVGEPGKLLKHENGKWVEYPQACICPTRLTISPGDVFWFVNGCDGVYMYNQGVWTPFDAEALGGFTPSQIMFAPDGAFWFFNYNVWTRYKPEE